MLPLLQYCYTSHQKMCLNSLLTNQMFFSQMSKSHGSGENSIIQLFSSLLLSQVAEKILASSPVARTKSLTEPSETKTRKRARASESKRDTMNITNMTEKLENCLRMTAMPLRFILKQTRNWDYIRCSQRIAGTTSAARARRFAETKESRRRERVASSYHSHPTTLRYRLRHLQQESAAKQLCIYIYIFFFQEARSCGTQRPMHNGFCFSLLC